MELRNYGDCFPQFPFHTTTPAYSPTRTLWRHSVNADPKETRIRSKTLIRIQISTVSRGGGELRAHVARATRHQGHPRRHGALRRAMRQRAGRHDGKHESAREGNRPESRSGSG